MPVRYFLMMATFSGAALCAIFFIQEYSLAQRSAEVPEEITLQNLVQRGPEGNANIILTDFEIGEHYLTKRKAVWVPVVPLGAETAPKSAAVHAFILCKDVRNEKEMVERLSKPKLACLVDPEADKPGIIGNTMFRMKYPQTEPSKCLILVEGKQPAGWLKLTLYALGAVLGLVLTGGIWFLARQLDKVEVPPVDVLPVEPASPGEIPRR